MQCIFTSRFGPKNVLLFSVGVLVCLTSLSAFSQQKVATTKQLKMDGGVTYYSAWLDQDVRWIITDNERAVFRMLKNNEERDHYIEAFWERRNPQPGKALNAFKQEHYRRIVYANEHFATGNIPGWKTNRGRTYIVHGSTTDQIESSERPNPASSDTECIQAVSAMSSPLQIEFKNLEEVVIHHISYDLLPFEVATRFVKATDATTLVQFTTTINDANVKFIDDGTKLSGKLHMFARILNLQGQFIDDFGNTLELNLPDNALADLSSHSCSFQNTVPLRPGKYRLDFVVKDVNGDKTGTRSRGLKVPE